MMRGLNAGPTASAKSPTTWYEGCLGFRAESVEFRVQGLGVGVWGLRFKFLGGLRVEVLEIVVKVLGFGV